jgi:hypothetical protein
MKVKYIQPEINILRVYGKDFIMQTEVVNGSKGTTSESGNGGSGEGYWDDDVKRRDAFDDKDITYGNIW